jgi:hypothetical protein
MSHSENVATRRLAQSESEKSLREVDHLGGGKAEQRDQHTTATKSTSKRITTYRPTLRDGLSRSSLERGRNKNADFGSNSFKSTSTVSTTNIIKESNRLQHQPVNLRNVAAKEGLRMKAIEQLEAWDSDDDGEKKQNNSLPARREDSELLSSVKQDVDSLLDLVAQVLVTKSKVLVRI